MSEKKKIKKNGRIVSEKTKELYDKRAQTFAKEKPTAKTRKEWNKKINRACRDDYREWISRWTEKIGSINKKRRHKRNLSRCESNQRHEKTICIQPTDFE